LEDRPIVFAFGGFEVDEALQELRSEGRRVELQAAPLRLLLHLLRNRDRVISKDELLDRIWPDVAVSETALSTALRKIRQALGDTGSQQRVIQTLRGQGYRLIAPVEEHPAASRIHPGQRSESDFVGRGPILGQLHAALADAEKARGRIVLLAGEAGIGKTRTAEELAESARSRGVPVHAAWCREDKGAPPYWPWVQILRGLIDGRSADALRSELGDGAARITRIVPEIRAQLPDLPKAPTEADPEEARFRLFDAIAGFLGRASAQEARILIVDDLHWAGESSLQLLEFLAHEIGEMRILFIGTYRDVEVDRDHPLAGSLAELARHDACTRTALGGLEVDEVRELVQRLVDIDPPEELVAEVLEKTDGNPFFIRELASLLAERDAEGKLGDAASPGPRVPAGVREVIRGRLKRLSPACTRALEVASIIGREFPVEILEETSDVGAEALEEALSEAQRTGFIGEAPSDGYRFTHALTQEAVYVELSPHRRAQLHGRVGEALERLHAADPDPHLADLARHFDAAGEEEKAVGYATRAGHRAMEQLAFEDAAQHFDLALHAMERAGAGDPIERCDLLLAMGWALATGTGSRESYRRVFLQAGQLARRCQDADRLAQAAAGFAGYQWTGVPDEEGQRLLEEALAALGSAETPRRAELLLRLAWALFCGNQFERANAVQAEAAELAERLDDPNTAAFVEYRRATLLTNRVRPEELLEALDEALRLADEGGGFQRGFVGWILQHRVYALLRLGDLAGADAAIARLAEEGPWHHFARINLAQYAVFKAMLTGRFDDAERLIAEAQALASRSQDPGQLNALAAQTYLLRRERGRISELEAGVRAAVEQYPGMPVWRCALARLFAELRRTEEAGQEFESMASSDFAVFSSADPLSPISLVLLAEVCVFLEDRRRAELLLELLRPHAHLNIITGSLAGYYGSAERPLGSLAALLRRFDESERHFEEALEMHRRMGARPWTAHTQHEFARMLLARGQARDRDRARELVGEALATARELGMVTLAERAQALHQEIQGAIPLRRRRASP